MAHGPEMNFTLVHLEICAQEVNITVFAMVTLRSVRPDLILR